MQSLRKALKSYRVATVAYKWLRDPVGMIHITWLTVRVNILAPPASWPEFKAATKVLLRRGDANRFATWLKRYDNQLGFSQVSQATVMDCRGRGGNLNAYRKVHLGERVAFEKVYDADSHDLKRVTYFHEAIKPILGQRVRTPTIYDVKYGSKLALVYFEYVDAGPASREIFLSVVAGFCKAVGDLSPSSTEDSSGEEFLTNSLYRAGVGRLREAVQRADRDVAIVSLAESFLGGASVNKRFAHGDLIPSNVLGDGWIIDFDRCGYYPDGFDIGRALGEGQVPGCITATEVEGFLRRQIAPPSDGSLASHLFFTAVFRARSLHRSRHQDDRTLLGLMDRAVELAGLSPSSVACR